MSTNKSAMSAIFYSMVLNSIAKLNRFGKELYFFKTFTHLINHRYSTEPFYQSQLYFSRALETLAKAVFQPIQCLQKCRIGTCCIRTLDGANEAVKTIRGLVVARPNHCVWYINLWFAHCFFSFDPKISLLPK